MDITNKGGSVMLKKTLVVAAMGGALVATNVSADMLHE